MQQMGLGPRPPGPMVGVQRPGLAAPAAPAAAVPRLATAPAAAAVGFPVRPAAPASGLVRPPAAGGLAPPGAVWPAGVVRPPGLQPQPRPGAPPHAAGAPSSVPNGYPGHPAAAAPQIRPGAVPLARPPGAHPGGLAAPQHPQYPPAAAPAAAAPPPGPGGLLAPRPPGFGAPAAAPAAAPGVGSGVSTPTKASFQQPHPGAAPASPPPYSLQVASPSPVKPGQLGSARGLQPPLAPGGLRPPGLPGPAFAGPGVPHSVGHPGLGGPPPLGMPPQQQPQQPYPAQPGLPGMGAPPGMVAPPGMGAPLQQPPAPAPGAGAKIDPAQIPRPSLARPVTQVFETRRENTHAVPPPADAPIVIKDRGSAGPRYMRSSLNMVPQSAELLRSAALPFVVIVNPLALPEPQDDPIQGYVDVATMGVLATGTGGSVYHYAPFSPEADGDEFHNDLCWNLLRPQARLGEGGEQGARLGEGGWGWGWGRGDGLEGLGRLRVSRGLGVDRFLGAFYRRTPTDLDFPALSCDHSLAAKLVHEEKLPEAGEVYLQYALLYSTPGGERRIRVHTLALPITQSLGTTFRGADLDAYLSYVARKVSSQVRRQRCGFLRLRVLRRGDPGEAAFYHALVEDRSPSAGMSYVEFLCFMHRQIQNRLG
eukprot:scaffold3.g6404.t1